ncbi:MAG: response regulator transcription factor [Thiobacillus sp.]|uniref:response regulator n=1 Tax=unclassified Thiobacillus TaxID=2646513 RepID=UPI0009691A1B|nr:MULTISPECIES: response regulator transcription factor [unclassified Thiobacillus]MBS0310555.1 response regulator transcription factor [Pseudomonadota bacterium]MBN8772334.1 response regulator transcription factor [Thiobacillus sp.]MBS0329116.1 response regulator transcription factor [Pseudomonadota bacterium]OJY59976.1 MAG: DNA-binding response regulator [Thiobacillus sp. 0-1251]QLQ03864.1 MAG: response regulator transcription factor [Thiobacillus sp.]
MIQVAIVDDHQIVRTGFRELLNEDSAISISFEAANGDDALAHLRTTPCDVLLLDISLPGKSGVDVLRTVRQRHPDLKVLILSGFPEESYALAMIKNGANGYLCKDCEQAELLKAIRTVSLGRRYVSPRTAELLADEMSGGRSGEPHEILSDRELQVFLRLVRGESVSEIAEQLHLSVKTISTYRSRLTEKLNVTSNAELATYAIRHGLITQ